MAATKMNQYRNSSCIWSVAVIPTPARLYIPTRRRCGRGQHLQSPEQPARYSIKSPHFWTVVSVGPHGMTGTDDVEFFGEPSINLSEYTM